MNDERTPRRALILAGGGLKVAFQAGVLQVLLDETDLEFELADGASGGVFNLSMWCQGMSGTEIADAWRRTNPLSWFSLSVRPWRSISSLERFRRNVLPLWGIDWPLIRARDDTEVPKALFNVYNFTKQRLETIRPRDMNEDLLLAGVTLPTWFPPAVIEGDVYIDAVYSTDANLEAAVERGANELWIIWTVSEEGKWRNGFVNQYFQTIEAAADGRLKESLRRIDQLNEARPPDDQITVEILRREVPLHYLFIFSADTLREGVEYGVQTAREWCRNKGIPLKEPRAERVDRTSLRFSETMKGFVGLGEEDPERGAQAGQETGTELSASLTIETQDLRRFLVDPQHEASVSGTVASEILGGPRPIDAGTFNQFVYEHDPERRKMLYTLHFRDQRGRRLTLEGEKRVPAAPRFRPWRDTTTLFTRIVRHPDDGTPEVAAAGVLELTVPAFLRELATFRARGRTRLGGFGFVLRYFAFFVGVCGRVYLSGWPLRTSSSAPRSELSQTNRKWASQKERIAK